MFAVLQQHAPLLELVGLLHREQPPAGMLLLLHCGMMKKPVLSIPAFASSSTTDCQSCCCYDGGLMAHPYSPFAGPTYKASR